MRASVEVRVRQKVGFPEQQRLYRMGGGHGVQERTWMRASAAVMVRQKGRKRPAAATALREPTATAAVAAAALPGE